MRPCFYRRLSLYTIAPNGNCSRLLIIVYVTLLSIVNELTHSEKGTNPATEIAYISHHSEYFYWISSESSSATISKYFQHREREVDRKCITLYGL